MENLIDSGSGWGLGTLSIKYVLRQHQKIELYIIKNHKICLFELYYKLQVCRHLHVYSNKSQKGEYKTEGPRRRIPLPDLETIL